MRNVIVQCFIIPKAIVSYFLYFTTDMGNDALELPIRMWYVCKKITQMIDLTPQVFDLIIGSSISYWLCIKHILRLPYDWKNPIGYLVAVSALLLWALFPFQYMGCIITLAFGVFMFATALVKDLNGVLHSINSMINDKESRNEMYKELSEFIRIHANAKQLSWESYFLYFIN